MPIELIQTDSQAILVDVVGPFGVTATAEQTKTPVESGSLRSDHKVLLPSQLQIEVRQTETPLEDDDFSFEDLDFEVPKVATKVISPFLLAGGLVEAGIDAIAGAFGPKPEAMQTLQAGSPRDRGGELADQLALVYAGDELATVTYRGRTYESMSLIGLTISYESGMAGLTTFQLTFEQVKIAEVARVALPDPNDLAHKAQAALGKKKAAEGADAAGIGGGKPKSILKSITG